MNQVFWREKDTQDFAVVELLKSAYAFGIDLAFDLARQRTEVLLGVRQVVDYREHVPTELRDIGHLRERAAAQTVDCHFGDFLAVDCLFYGESSDAAKQLYEL